MIKESLFSEAYQSLNSKQKQAVDAIDGPVMVIAGPGTGKTQIIAVRIANILRETDTRPEAIVALTFTESGVKAMRERLIGLIGSDAYYVQIATFHSFCSEIIRSNPDHFTVSPDFQPISDLERYEIIQKAVEANNFKFIKPAGSMYHYVKAIIGNIQILKREGFLPPEYRKIVEEERYELELLSTQCTGKKGGVSKTKIAELSKKNGKNMELLEVYYLYQKELLDRSRFDFEDMINFVVYGLRTIPELLLSYQERFQYLLVDEFQDTNSAQNNLVMLLSSYWGENANIFVVGDSNQSIFRFQGASLENILSFKKTYPGAKYISLTENYRSTQTILDSAWAVIGNNKQRSETILDLENKGLKSQGQNAELEIGRINLSSDLAEDLFIVNSITELIESGVEPKEIAVIFKNNKDAVRLAKLSLGRGIQVSIQGGKNILLEPAIRQLVNLLRVIKNISRASEGVDLYTVLNYSFFNLDLVDNLKISREAARRRVRIIDVLLDSDFKTGVIVSNPEKYLSFLGKMTAWLQLENELALPQFLEKVSIESGFIKYLEGLPDSLLAINRLRGFFDAAVEMYNRDPEINLDRFLENLLVMEGNNISMDEPVIDFDNNSVTLTTAHKAKGLEWNYVFIYQCVNGKWGNTVSRELIKLPDGILRFEKMAKDESRLEKNEEERRLFYVSLTRARKQVTITTASHYYQDNNAKETLPSMFISEIPADFIQTIDSTATEKRLQENLSQLIATSEIQNVTEEREKELLEQIISEYNLSASGLNTYLRCAYQFKLEQLVKVPNIPNINMLFGQAVHKALENSFKKLLKGGGVPTERELVEYYLSALSELPLKGSDRNYRQEYGTEVLSEYYKARNGDFKKPLFVERWFGGKNERVLLDGEISLIGKIDRIETVGNSKTKVKIVDYKTGSVKTEGQIAGTQSNSDGNLKRQLVFYKLLTELDTRFKYEVTEVLLDFVESPKREGDWIKRSAEIGRAEIDALIQEIRVMMKNIRLLQFPKTENYHNCVDCPFQLHCWPEGTPEKMIKPGKNS